jgi:hypothetical protein
MVGPPADELHWHVSRRRLPLPYADLTADIGSCRAGEPFGEQHEERANVGAGSRRPAAGDSIDSTTCQTLSSVFARNSRCSRGC